MGIRVRAKSSNTAQRQLLSRSGSRKPKRPMESPTDEKRLDQSLSSTLANSVRTKSPASGSSRWVRCLRASDGEFPIELRSSAEPYQTGRNEECTPPPNTLDTFVRKKYRWNVEEHGFGVSSVEATPQRYPRRQS